MYERDGWKEGELYVPRFLIDKLVHESPDVEKPIMICLIPLSTPSSKLSSCYSRNSQHKEIYL